MYAVVETGGKQYRVAIGDKLKVEKLDVEEGSSIELDRVLMISENDELKVGEPVLEGTAVGAKVLSQGRPDKIKVYKFKRRKKYRRTQGHRQSYTELEITSIGDVKSASKKSKESKPKNDDLSDIEGLGSKLEKKLSKIGITSFQQIADLTPEQVADIDDKLKLEGRIDRKEWIAQAKKLAS